MENNGYMKTLLHRTASTVYEPRNTFSSNMGKDMTKVQQASKGHIVHYGVNGSGRDEYIYKDNGGFNLMYEPVPYVKSTALVDPCRFAK